MSGDGGGSFQHLSDEIGGGGGGGSGSGNNDNNNHGLSTNSSSSLTSGRTKISSSSSRATIANTTSNIHSDATITTERSPLLLPSSDGWSNEEAPPPRHAITATPTTTTTTSTTTAAAATTTTTTTAAITTNIAAETLGHAAYMWLYQCLPVVAATLCRVGLYTIDTAYLGHLSTSSLAGSSMAGVMVNVVFAAVSGAASCLNPLGSQAWGAGNYKLLGIWLQISVLVTSLLCLPGALLFALTDDLLRPFVSDRATVQAAGLFARWSILSLWPAMMYCAVRQFFQVQGILMPATLVSLVATGVNIGFNQLFIFGTGSGSGSSFGRGLGFVGSPLATASTFVFQLATFLLWTCTLRRLHIPAWPGWSRRHITWTRLKRYLQFALPAVATQVLDEAAYQGIMLMAGRLGATDVGAMAVCNNAFAVVWAFTWGGALATEICVGSALGAGRPWVALRDARLGFFATLLLVSIPAGTTVFLGGDVALPFTNDAAIRTRVDELTPLLAGCFWAHSAKMVLGQTLEGVGRPRALAVTVGVGSWVVTLPLAYVFCFVLEFGLPGLWAAPLIGEASQALILFILLLRTSWLKMAVAARKRAEVGASSPTVQCD